MADQGQDAIQAGEEPYPYDQLEALMFARTAELQDRSHLLDSVFDHALSSLVLLDTQFNFVRVNQIYAESCGRAIEDFQGHNHFVDYPSDELQATFEQVVRTRQAWQCQARPFVFPDHPDWGTTYWNLSLVPILDAQGQVELLLFSLRDVTARKQAEDLAQARLAALEESERKYRELVQNANSAIIRWNLDGELIFANECAEELFGYGPGELLGQYVTVLVPSHLESGFTPEGLMQAILADPETFEKNENENVTKDGRLLWVAWTNRLIYDEDGQLESLMAIGTDRTAQHDAQLKLRRLTAELALAEQRERRRIATILHDDLAQLLVSAKLALANVSTLDALPAVHEACAAVLGMLQEAITAARDVTVELSSPVLYGRGLAEAIGWTAQRVHEQSGLLVSVETEGEVRRLASDAEITIFQAVKEMLNNVVRHAHANRACITVIFTEHEIRVVVADDGQGFDPTATRLTSESGFGLLNASERLNYLGGRLDVESVPGEGSRLTLVCPA